MYGTQDASHFWQLSNVTLVGGVLGGFPRGEHSAALFHNPNEDVKMAVHGDGFVCLSDDNVLKTHRQTSQIQTQRKTWEHMDSKSQT